MNYLSLGKGKAFAIFTLSTGGFIYYQQKARYHRMLKTFATGNILHMSNYMYEVPYFQRADLHARLDSLFNRTFTGQYYLITGELGSGKSRTVLEIVRELIRTEGVHHEGAPIYMHASQGCNFADSLAAAVDFRFDEHISLTRFVEFVLQIRKLPGSSSHHRLERVLSSIEESAVCYTRQHGRPVVLVIDGVPSLIQRMPGALEKLQEKAALWADMNIVKVVLVMGNEMLEKTLVSPSSATAWSRACTPVIIGDISESEAVTFLQEAPENDRGARCMMQSHAELIISLVGGRMHHLIKCKQAWKNEEPFDQIAAQLVETEREKFVSLSRVSNGWQSVGLLQKAPGNRMLLSKLIESTTAKDVNVLFNKNIIKCTRTLQGFMVEFDSKLTVNVVNGLYKKN